jgi:hypothetical protein
MSSRKPSWRTGIFASVFLCSILICVRQSMRSHSHLVISVLLSSQMEDLMISHQTNTNVRFVNPVHSNTSYTDFDDGESESDNDPPPDAKSLIDGKTLVDAIVSGYQYIVSSHLHHQAASWFRYLGSYRVEEDDVEIESTLRNFQRRRNRSVYQGDKNQTFIWDKEEDIPL